MLLLRSAHPPSVAEPLWLDKRMLIHCEQQTKRHRLQGAFFVATIVFSFVCCCARSSYAQTTYTSRSLEWLVTDADMVLSGRVTEVSREPIDNGRHWSVVTVDVGDVFKGHRAATVRFVVGPYVSDPFDQWRESDTNILWFLKRREGRHEDELSELNAILERNDTELYGELGWQAIPLEAQVDQPQRPRPPIITIDLRLLETSEEILDAVREAVAFDEEHGAADTEHVLQLFGPIVAQTGYPADANYLLIPVDARLEAFAQRLIESTNHFVPTLEDQSQLDERRLQHIRNSLRREGAEALGYFSSEENAGILRRLLNDGATLVEVSERDGTTIRHRVYHVREAAYETLVDWGVDVEAPILRERHFETKGDH